MCRTVQCLPPGKSCSSLSHSFCNLGLDLENGPCGWAGSHREARGARLSHSGHPGPWAQVVTASSHHSRH